MNLIVLIFVVLILFSVGGSYGGYYSHGYGFGGGGLLLLILLVLFLSGRL
jgi:hypothetical protein